MAAPSTSSSSTFPYPTLLRHPLSSPTTRPPAEHITNIWILEFMLRQPIPDPLADELLRFLHSHSNVHPHLRKILLLRGISSEVRRRSISVSTLQALELIMELDRHRRIRPSNRFKAAYCAAAVECTASAFLSSRRDFVNVVESIWMSDVAQGLVSEPFLEWGKKMERCLSTGKGGEEILKRDVGDAMGLVREYLDEAWRKMGPSFLEIVAAELVDKRTDLDAVARNAGKDVTEITGCSEKLEHDGGGISIGAMEEGGVRERSGRTENNSVKDLGVGEAREEFDGLAKTSKMQDADLNVDPKSGIQSVEVEVENERGVNAGRLDMARHSRCNIQQIDPSEVRKVKEALKKSCFDLRRAAEDPLPEAKAVAAAVLDSMSRAHALLDETDGQSSMKNPDLIVPHVELVGGVPAVVETNAGDLEKEKRNSFDLKEVEGNQIIEECKNDAGPSKTRTVVASHRLFERNPTAHTSEWTDDSLESSSRKEKAHLSSPMSRRTGFDRGKFVRRRAVKRWTPQEEQTLREAVAKYGKGNWKLILNRYSEIFQERTEIDLKDKWRNMCRHLS
ncbi:uncharacterized protein LOC110021369 [Phalaenopsis equestris]|uniref:uncharacterized protein LOC110021369 n=1 Tax=Phalaenopsis equestris TaxID=78828 RepID=UPI0009E5DA47|nr:uncharacterized protein LOC110021369 [Phalaenopsis equestris]